MGILSLAGFLTALAAAPFSRAEEPCAVIATSLASFEGIEEPTVRYSAGGERLAPDGFVNIVDLGDGAFRTINRFLPGEWWDGDRDTTNRDRQRAEVKGLGPHQRTGETFEYTTTWRTNPTLRGSARFSHIFQLKATDGDSGAPLVTVSLHPGNKASLRYWTGMSAGSTVAHEWNWTPDRWQTLRIRIRTSTEANGEVTVSIDDSPFNGVTGLALFRPDATAYRPKWGLYRGASAGLALGEDHIDHKQVSAGRLAADGIRPAPCRNHVALETAALREAQRSPVEAARQLHAHPSSRGRALAAATLAGKWAESDPDAAVSWAETLADDDGRNEAVMRAFNRWADQDPTAAARWLATRSPDPRLDPLIWFFTTDTTLRYVNRAPALAAAPLIADPELRYQSIAHIALIWARQHPEEAAAYAAGAIGLSTSQREILVAQIRAAGTPR